MYLHNAGVTPSGISVLPSASPETTSFSIRATPFGPRAPPIPTARAVTVARVASPLANDRTYQPLFLRGLRRYFEGTVRLVKEGDLIAVGIDEDSVRFVNGESAGGENEQEGEELSLLDHE